MSQSMLSPLVGGATVPNEELSGRVQRHGEGWTDK